MISAKLIASLIFWGGATAAGRVLDIREYGAIPFSKEANVSNAGALNASFLDAQDGDTILVPANQTFFVIGGIRGDNLTNVTFLVEGTLTACFDLDNWPRGTTSVVGGNHYVYLDLIALSNATDLIVTSFTRDIAIDGGGEAWWNACLLGKIGYGDRPVLLSVAYSTRVVVSGMDLVNSPRFHLFMFQNEDIEIFGVSVRVDRRLSEVKIEAQKRRGKLHGKSSMMTLQPEDVNTDGIDVSGIGAWIHDCNIQNDDDSIAIKPAKGTNIVGSQNHTSFCTQDILVERVNMTGFGASVGSVSPELNLYEACVRNVTFRNILMPNSGKGIYIKSNPGCDKGKQGLIEQILYENVTITNPRWWPIWIGPQQQHEPGTELGDHCSLAYPEVDHCPQEDCVTFRNITLRNIAIVGSFMSPGVIIGNASNPIRGLIFDRVQAAGLVAEPAPFGNAFECSGVSEYSSPGSNPALECT